MIQEWFFSESIDLNNLSGADFNDIYKEIVIGTSYRMVFQE